MPEGSVETTVTKATRVRGPEASEFIRIWQESADLNEFVKRTGMHKASAQQRATKYRAEPHLLPLKKMPRGGGGIKLDYDALRALCIATAPAETAKA